MPTRLAACPASPNCVLSDAADTEHRVEPFALAVAADVAWPRIMEAVKSLPRTSITQAADGYLHAECVSLVFRFVDDLELELRGDEGVVAVRSASRTGYRDFGVNRGRVQRLREILRGSGVIR